MNWKKHFSEIILERGYNYFLDGCVEDLETCDNGYAATVCGTEDYKVEIVLNNDRVSDMYCTCPYADDGNYCKHMAAVLFAVEKSENRSKLKEIPVFEGKEIIELEVLMEAASPEELRAFLLEQMRAGETLWQEFRIRFSKNVSDEDMHRYKRMIHQIFNAYNYDIHQEFDYYGDEENDADDALELVDEIRNFADKYIEVMLDRQDYEPAFWLVSEIAVALDEHNTYECEDISDEIIEICREYWLHILEKNHDKALKKKAFEWFQEALINLDAIGDVILSLFMECFSESEYFNGKLQTFDKKLQLLESRQTVNSTEYELTMWVLTKLELMRIAEDNDSCRQIEEQYWRLPGIRKARIDQCLESSNIRGAIQILKESREMDTDKLGLVIDYCRQIRELYYKLGDMESCRMEARNILRYAGQGFLDDFREWKALCGPEEWETERENVFAIVKDSRYLKELYFEEKLYDRLMDCLMKSTTEWELSEYEKVLKPLYPDELLAWYEADVRRRAEYTGGREHYKHLVDTLIHMQKYPNGKERINAITDEWRYTYKRRLAMMEELKKKGL